MVSVILSGSYPTEDCLGIYFSHEFVLDQLLDDMDSRIRGEGTASCLFTKIFLLQIEMSLNTFSASESSDSLLGVKSPLLTPPGC